MRAPGGPGAAIGQGPGRKQAFGAAPGPRSQVWLTVGGGTLSDVFYPTVDRPFLQALGFLIAAPGAPPIYDAAEARHEVRWIEAGVPAFRAHSVHPEYTLTKEFVPDPESDAIVVAVTFRPEMPDLQLYLQASVHGIGDAYALDTEPRTLCGHQDGRWLALAGPFARCSVGYQRTSDLLVDLHDSDGVMTQEYSRADSGHVALGALIGLAAGSFQVGLGFGRGWQEAEEAASAALESGAGRLREELAAAERLQPDLDRNIFRVSGDGGALARSSVVVLRSMEDKQRPGTFGASSVRESFRVASALLDAGDPGPARRLLSSLERGRDGDAPGAQPLDELAYPILLAWRLAVAGELQQNPWDRLVSPVVSHIVTNGPAGGNLGVLVSALVAAADFADDAGEPRTADHLLEVADSWNEAIDGLALPSENGGRSGPHELVRLGLRSADDPSVIAGLASANAAQPGNDQRDPLLTADRGMRELALGRPAAEQITALEAAAGPELLFSEDGALAPLGLAHAAYLQLLVSLAQSRLPDRIDPVYRRYAQARSMHPPALL